MYCIILKIQGMTITFNNTLQQLPDNTSIEEALQAVGITSYNGMAVAVNNNILKKEEWPCYQLKPQDVVVLIRASQGG